MTDFRFEQIRDQHDCQYFESGIPSLDFWLQREALNAHRGGLSRTHVSVEEGDDYLQVRGYFTLCPTVVTDLAGGREGGYPSYLLCKLARHADLRKTGHGGDLLAEAMAKTVEAADAAGGRFLVVDPHVDDADRAHTGRVRDFYRDNGFQDMGDGVNRMYISIKTIRRQL
ncbi:acetyltransferase (GNAT) family protein [Mycobacterium intracellulare subsp. chimaera]|uniref:hypothetical protein n=1 Tax=Mycobacterium intracellulare TaxID=1767 RepID=UPI00093B9ACD|nr:hypothetical protein [Mycobacterium intracellulare]ASL11058.1 acetyltransferase (GNAT) family protein [Mycobacterium intracellulare subsp. chimaera]MCV7324542.1 hypothetical protein [Mycobacterium intracellulare subsp. chimaera]ORV33104.1 hypothetical protein AWB97_10075 [Mycobacterium intracellulare subsp. chimaera]